MPRFSTLYVLFLICLVASTSVYATNGSNLIGLTPVSTGMGGTGIAYHTGVESLLKNPALISYQDTQVFLMGLNHAAVDSQSRVNYMNVTDTGFVKSEDTNFFIPEIGLAGPLAPHWHYGLGLFGVSGFGIDHRNQTEGNGILANIRSHMMALKLAPGIAYSDGPLSLGLTTHLTYAQMNFGALLPDSSGSPVTSAQRGGGVSDALSVGFQGGIGYEVDQNWRLGATYMTPIPLEFKRLFDFDRNGTYDTMTFELPAELGAGLHARFAPFDFTLDIKQIFWSSAKGFQNLKWRDQTVFALGTQYKVTETLDVRMGYNYSPSVIEQKNNLSAANGTSNLGDGTFLDSNIAFFNMVGMGGVVGEHSITLGAGYQINPSFRLDGSFQIGIGNTVSQSGKTTLAAPDDTNAEYSTKASTFITTIAGVWQF